MIEQLASVVMANPVGILLTGVFVGAIAKIFRRRFILGFLAGILPQIVTPFAFQYLPIPTFPLAPMVVMVLVYFFFIWILCRFGALVSLAIAILTVGILEFGMAYTKQVLFG